MFETQTEPGTALPRDIPESPSVSPVNQKELDPRMELNRNY